MEMGTHRCWRTHHLWNEAGEGVISTAIAVLIMAFIGAAMWAAFNGVFTSASDDIRDQVAEIGTGG